eukprot:scaffold284112_cov28-Tisochrysis_lutea.AAC.5
MSSPTVCPQVSTSPEVLNALTWNAPAQSERSDMPRSCSHSRSSHCSFSNEQNTPHICTSESPAGAPAAERVRYLSLPIGCVDGLVARARNLRPTATWVTRSAPASFTAATPGKRATRLGRGTWLPRCKSCPAVFTPHVYSAPARVMAAAEKPWL